VVDTDACLVFKRLTDSLLKKLEVEIRKK